MQHTPGPGERTYCLRHPDTETNLRCGRCNELICPRCMVSSPVGARCPSCSRIGRPAILDTSSTELGQAILFAVLAGVLGAFALSVVLKILVSLPFAVNAIDLIVVAGGMAGIGYGIGEAVRYGSGKKLDRRLKYVVAVGVLVAWIATFTFLPIFNVPNGIVAGLSGIIGLIAAFYIGSSRVRI